MKHVLLTDEDARILALHRWFFADEGYEVETAASGLECLAKVRLHDPDVVVLDWHLPWGGGAGVLACMREGSVTSAPVVLIGVLEAAHADFSPPVVTYMQKPFRLDALMGAVVGAAEQVGRPRAAGNNACP